MRICDFNLSSIRRRSNKPEQNSVKGGTRTCRERRERTDVMRMTHSGHRPDRNPAAVSCVPRCAIVSPQARERVGEELIMHTFSFAIFATSLFWPARASAQLNVLISGGFSGAYEQLLPEFERTSGIFREEGSEQLVEAALQTTVRILKREIKHVALGRLEIAEEKATRGDRDGEVEHEPLFLRLWPRSKDR